MLLHRDQSAPTHERREAVRIVSVPLAGEIAVLFCGPLAGLLVHRFQGRPVGCPGEGSCPTAHHRSRTLWYGYAPARVWRAQQQDWAACVIEVTEALEELLHGRQLRGELWMLQRDTQRKKTGPVTGVYLETRADQDTPPPFDLAPALYRLYHTNALALGVPNPVPAKVVLPVARLAPPPGPEAFGLAEPPRPAAMDLESLRRLAPRGLAAAAREAGERNGREKH